MTSLSRDIRTPLTSLIGYLDAIQDSVVEGEERDEYLYIAQTKAYDLKEYANSLFEWFKLHSNVRTFRFERIDIEITRSLLID